MSSAHLLTNKKLPVPSVVLSFTPGLVQQTEAVAVTIDCYVGGRYDFKAIFSCDWKEIFQAVLEHHTVSVTLGVPSKTDWSEFVDKVASEHTQELLAAGKLCVAYWDNQDSTWVPLVGNGSGFRSLICFLGRSSILPRRHASVSCAAVYLSGRADC